MDSHEMSRDFFLLILQCESHITMLPQSDRITAAAVPNWNGAGFSMLPRLGVTIAYCGSPLHMGKTGCAVLGSSDDVTEEQEKSETNITSHILFCNTFCD